MEHLTIQNRKKNISYASFYLSAMMKTYKFYHILMMLTLTCTYALSLNAQVKLPSIFTNNMVLQQQSECAFWGWSEKGKNISIQTSWNGKRYTTKADAAGKWKMLVPTPAAGGPYNITISDGKPVTLNNVLIGEVWICSGQSNMEMPVKGFKGQPIIGSNEAILHSKNKNIRLYTVPRSSVTERQDNCKPSEWKEAGPEAVSNFSATGYFFGRLLNEMLDVPVGLINVSYSGSFAEAWMSPDALKVYPDVKIPAKGDTIKAVSRTPTTLYNGMLYPIIGYSIKGSIWYQGESNYENPDRYEELFPKMVNEWRTLWNRGEFPFYYAQIAPYNYAQLPPYNMGGKYNSAYLRDAQRKAETKISNSGMAVLMDIGEEDNIHPAHKKEGGERLALLALGKTYGLKGFGYTSPSFDSTSVNGNIMNVFFQNAPNGLTSFGKKLTSFEIAGSDKVFYPAQAVLLRNSIAVSSPNVAKPVAVRYAFKDFTKGELFSTEGLPASSFRTDNW
ncbi:sialate O-acetylesterase [Chitinophagaceae bacterium LB-8]|uniref:Sialate O-acetylesterase n=1 Tax=Paraflavisolibacter caeni TaxID=2982496 RepID=A0A9X2XZ74_9BACT|nr:sialate O-acetylesterase [Paraflavisolibacter caeni]MCU7551925.1 sialate O-acetylesterase [Paraflavisolibacter caeni]